VKTGQSLSKMSKPTALHTEGTAQVSERLNIADTAKKLYLGKSISWLNIADTAKKLYYGKSISEIAVVITIELQTRT